MISALFMLVFVSLVGLGFKLIETKIGQKVISKINIF